MWADYLITESMFDTFQHVKKVETDDSAYFLSHQRTFFRYFLILL
jgi:hypothetical protein